MANIGLLDDATCSVEGHGLITSGRGRENWLYRVVVRRRLLVLVEWKVHTMDTTAEVGRGLWTVVRIPSSAGLDNSSMAVVKSAQYT